MFPLMTGGMDVEPWARFVFQVTGTGTCIGTHTQTGACTCIDTNTFIGSCAGTGTGTRIGKCTRQGMQLIPVQVQVVIVTGICTSTGTRSGKDSRLMHL